MTSGYLVSRLSGYRRIGLSGYLAVSLVGCTLGTPSEPSLSGPAEFGTSLAVTASPDLMARDGSAQSLITVTARDGNGQPVRNLSLRVDVKVGGVLGDLGTLSARTISTANDGRASVTYTAPPPASFGAPNEATVQVVASLIGTDAANAQTSGVSIRLTSPGVIQPPNGTPVASFFVSPTSPREEEDILFDGSASRDPDGRIMTYLWTFGDGDIAATNEPTVRHHYDIAGSYRPTLTVTDDRGLSATSAPVSVTVSAAGNPVASFVFSPTPVLAGATVYFNGSASTAPVGREIQTWQWDFGDGQFATRAVPTTTHSFAAAGTYRVVLTVTDDIGRTATVTVTVTVG